MHRVAGQQRAAATAETANDRPVLADLGHPLATAGQAEPEQSERHRAAEAAGAALRPPAGHQERAQPEPDSESAGQREHEHQHAEVDPGEEFQRDLARYERQQAPAPEGWRQRRHGELTDGQLAKQITHEQATTTKPSNASRTGSARLISANPRSPPAPGRR